VAAKGEAKMRRNKSDKVHNFSRPLPILYIYIFGEEVHDMSETDTATRKIRVPTNLANFKTPEIPCNEKIPLDVDGKPLWESQCRTSPQSGSASGILKDLWEQMKAMLDGLL
jgi:hypothetical protein